MPAFFIVNLVGLGINTFILLRLSGPLTSATSSLLLSLGPERAYKVGYNAAKAFATGVVMFWNFFANRLWTYNDVRTGS